MKFTEMQFTCNKVSGLAARIYCPATTKTKFWNGEDSMPVGGSFFQQVSGLRNHL